MPEPRDNAQRRQALDPDRSFIVQAPAGSGKTELLIRRFLVLLGRVEMPEQIVAITFTRKAAAEMRSRVVEALKMARLPRPEEPLAAELWQLAQAAMQRDQTQDWQLAQHPSRLQIQTIDALCLGLVRRMPWLSRCGAPMAIVDDARELYRQAALDTVHLLADSEPAWSQAVERLLRHLDNQVSIAVSLLTDMLTHRDQWLRTTDIGHDDVDAATRRAELEDAWRSLSAHQVAQARTRLQRHDVRGLLDSLNYAAAELSALHDEHMLIAWGERTALPADDELAAWQALCNALLTKTGSVRRQVNKNTGFPPGNKQAKQQMESLLATMAQDALLREALATVYELPSPQFTDTQWQVLEAINLLLPLAAARLQVLFGEQGVADFTEINQRANLALGRVDAPTDLALKLDYRIQHLLVDEFQDTSYTQYIFLALLTAGWQPGDGRSLFLVGDPKQSIYRFREADVGLFQTAAEQGIGEVSLDSIQLGDNFRSDPKLVNWVNQVLPHAFPQASDAQLGAIPYAPSTAACTEEDGAGVFVHALADDDGRAEAQRVVALVKECRARRPQAQIAILVRARTHLAQLLPALQAARVPCVGVDTQSLAQQPAVQDIMALTRALLQPADRVAWLSILRAPWCGLSLQDLHAVAGDGDDCLWQRLNTQSLHDTLSSDARHRLARVVPVLAQALRRRGRQDWRSVVEAAWIALGGPATVSDSAAADVETFLRLLREYEDDDALLFALERKVADQWAAPEADPSSAVQIMTMHKAKGLQFDVVILPSLQRKARSGDDPLLRWEEIPGLGLLLAPRKARGGEDGHHRFLGTLHQRKEKYENGRLLYVACTRARYELHLLATLQRDDNGDLRAPKQGLLPFIWPGVAQQLQLPARTEPDGSSAPDNDTTQTAGTHLRRLPVDWQAPDWQRFALTAQRDPPLGGDEAEPVEFSWAGESARHVGVVVHEVLQVIADQGLADWDHIRLQSLRETWRQELSSRGLPDEQLSFALQRVEQALTQVLDDPRAQWLFDPAQCERRSEFAISVWRHGRVQSMKMDLTFVDQSDRRWIVDYKTSAHEGGDEQIFLDREVERYREQLHGYAAAMAQLDRRSIHLALYFPLLQGWREWPYEQR